MLYSESVEEGALWFSYLASLLLSPAFSSLSRSISATSISPLLANAASSRATLACHSLFSATAFASSLRRSAVSDSLTGIRGSCDQ